jgi:hypothetical protein
MAFISSRVRFCSHHRRGVGTYTVYRQSRKVYMYLYRALAYTYYTLNVDDRSGTFGLVLGLGDRNAAQSQTCVQTV